MSNPSQSQDTPVDPTGNPQPQNPPPPGVWVPSYQWSDARDDEIDLFELIAGLWRRRFLIVALTAAFVIAAAGYVTLIATPTFVVEARIRPATEQALIGLNKARSFSVGPAAALAQFSAEFQSRSVLQSAFDAVMSSNPGTVAWTGEEMPPSLTREQLFLEGFLPRINIEEETVPSGNESIRLLSFEAQNAEAGRDTLDAIIQRAKAAATTAITNSFTANLDLNISQRKRELERILAQIADGRTDMTRIATEVAQSETGQGIAVADSSGVRYTSVSAQLQAEIAQLEVLQKIPLDNLQVIRIDQPPIAPTRPVKPKKTLIVAAAGVAGALFSLLVALVLNARDARRASAISQ
ncbi:Chain length determinant protein [Luminiphilus syltensis NOR5-1B]|uniref:Chain length determinant protein n=1 Tax=Luminiphilus syltensis NOR5-1B TaxID=565045 RepID=B8KUX8_9GAMM|nr:Wzz/FepE/Etk N-terminal domain-containing protein [Luminiphilus syltensis]EED36316.1 Chain length determinant protein [Luminiphilus syltensis NOR5-1B]